MIDVISQIVIVITGISSVWLTQQNNDKWKKYACLFGLASEPFWFYTAYAAEQWGVVLLVFVYTYCWGLGVKNYWFVK